MSDQPPNKPNLNSIKKLLEMLSMGKELTEAQHKEMKDYKFWKTQPVISFDEKISQEGPIDSRKTVADISEKPLPLLEGFEWDTLDLTSTKELDEVYNLLHENYVEDSGESFRFKYSAEFFDWALKPPGWKKDWHVGVRVKSSKRLVAFISAIPLRLKLHDKIIESVEINFLCVHKKLRSKRLTPVLIKEITRRVNRYDIWQALYTAGIVLPSPISTCRYTHRPINWEKLHEVGFSSLPEDSTKEDMVKKYYIDENNEAIKLEGLRKMTEDDVDEVLELYNKFQAKYELIQVFDKEDLKHWLLKGKEVIYTYVVEDKSNKKITDFFSFYLLPFKILNVPKHEQLNISYLFYYGTDHDSSKKELETRLKLLMKNALVINKGLKIDVFNALTSQDNTLFLEDLNFGLGDGYLNYYLFNYKAFPILGGINKHTKLIEEGSGIGVVML
ncbi:glycylpeptide N-tetradecanoyltransferase NMT1 [Ascoidea rubescens DSM 1968]|uniref:Glycylpeptide N-tetradecanoyltransferase n=1 Tax=Ascoidea rubescens DSM 1968 TaxID=1344418 RepID=A0A1D2VL20_9ASCO|nr:myristoyl-CoA:protein N myristoyltransferase [Ascoidea rubescens DSM 1968]ODV62292.1 myristoyl-CoA:protein N myristoyltransferase [Ascoidea rubescens DSM 1968]